MRIPKIFFKMRYDKTTMNFLSNRHILYIFEKMTHLPFFGFANFVTPWQRQSLETFLASKNGFQSPKSKNRCSLPSNKKFLISLILFFWLLAAGENEKFLEVRLHWAGEKTKLALLGWSPFSELSTLVSRKFPSFVKISPNDFTKKVNNQN